MQTLESLGRGGDIEGADVVYADLERAMSRLLGALAAPPARKAGLG